MAGSVKLLAVGDLLLCGRYDDIASAGSAHDVFVHLRESLISADLGVGNLESVVATGGQPRDDKLCLRGDPMFVEALSAAGFGVLSLANNHAGDYGWPALDETLKRLDLAGIEAVGAGSNAAAAAEPCVIERNGQKIGFLGFCHASTAMPVFAGGDAWGVAELDTNPCLMAIERLASKVDHVVLLLHWGLEYSPMPTPDQVEFAHQAVEHGARLIIGHHSHMVQGIEHYNDGVIAYSLGNCTDSAVDWQGPTRHFHSEITEVDRMGLALNVELTPDTVRITDLEPLWLNDNGQPEPASGDRRAAILEQINVRSDAIVAGDLKEYWEKALVDKRVTAPLLHWWRSGSMWDKVRGLKLSQFQTLYLLGITWFRIRFSRANERWTLFNPRNDKRPMPYAGDEDKD